MGVKEIAVKLAEKEISRLIENKPEPPRRFPSWLPKEELQKIIYETFVGIIKELNAKVTQYVNAGEPFGFHHDVDFWRRGIKLSHQCFRALDLQMSFSLFSNKNQIEELRELRNDMLRSCNTLSELFGRRAVPPEVRDQMWLRASEEEMIARFFKLGL